MRVIKQGTGKAVITETGKAFLSNLQHNDTAISEEVRRDYGIHQVTDGYKYGIGMWRRWHEATVMLIYGKQAIIDGMDIHATLQNIRHKNQSISVILCKYNKLLWKYDHFKCTVNCCKVSLLSNQFWLLLGAQIQTILTSEWQRNDSDKTKQKSNNELQFCR